nr:reverse transcriptase domain-containing protein [Tanacetum cinerariifolium]
RNKTKFRNKTKMDINIDALYNILKQNQGDVNDAMGSKKKNIVVTFDPLALIAEKTNVSRSKEKSANKKREFVKTDTMKVEKKDDKKKRDMSRVKCHNCKKEGHFTKDCMKTKVKHYEYYKTKMLLAKKDKDEQVLLVEDQAWMESSSDSDQEINANMVFLAQIEKVLSDFEASSSSTDEKISEVSYYLSELESESEYATLEYYDNSTNYGLFVNNDDDQEIFHDAIESASENFIENHIDSQKDYEKSDADNKRRRDQDNEQIEKFFEIFKDMSFEISFTDALILMPKFASTLKALIGNKEKLSEMARTPMNEHCSAVILNKFPRKLGDPGKFLIPCEFPRMDECLALADLGASINLMPFFVWEVLSLPKLTPTCMTLELADRSVSKPIGIAKVVSFKVGVFHFPANFVVVDFEPDPRVPLILGRCFLKTGRALIDVYKGELTLRIENEAITYNLDQTVRYSANYNQMTANKIDVIKMACEEYSQEVLSFSNVTTSGNPTPHDDPIVSTTSPTLTPFGDSNFLLFEEADAFLGLEDDPDSPKINPFYYDLEEDILLLETILNKEDYKPVVQHQRRVNPKIHDVIEKEVEKLLDAGLIYPISDSPWVSPVHCVPKKGGFTVVKNQENELIPNRLVTGWRANDAILKNMQTNMTSLKNSNLELKNMFGQFMKMNIASSSGLGTLPGNTVTNLKEELEGITTRSGTAYQGPKIPTSSSLPQVVEREAEVTKDTMYPTNNGSTKDIQPSVVQIETPVLNPELVVAPIIEPVAAPVTLADLGASINLMPLSTWNKLSLPELSSTCMTLELADPITFNLDQTSRYSANYNDMTANRIDVIDMACEEYSQEVLSFSDVIAIGNPTPYNDPIVYNSSLTLTLFGDSDFLLKEVDAFLDLEDDATSSEVDQSYFDPKGDILLLEAFLSDDPSLPPLTQGNYLP